MNYKLLTDSNVCLSPYHKKDTTRYSASFCSMLCVLFGVGCAFGFCVAVLLGWVFCLSAGMEPSTQTHLLCLSCYVVLNPASPLSCSETL